MDTLTGIKMFLQVVESGSFVAAADRLDVSTAITRGRACIGSRRLACRCQGRAAMTTISTR